MLEPLLEWLQWWVIDTSLSLIKGIATGLWYIEKVIAWLVDQITTSTIWETIIGDLFSQLSATVPDTLRSVIFGTGGGLFYIAIIAVGFTLIVPQMVRKGSRPVELDRVLMWSIFVVALFISSTAGFDLIATVELARQDMATTVAGSGTNLSDLVTAPMSATSADITVTGFELPTTFENLYFPEPLSYHDVEIVFYDAPIIGENSATVEVEDEVSVAYRQEQATLGIVIVTLNLAPTLMVGILGVTFAALTASAIVLLLFFIFGIPLGLFEFGTSILSQIFKRYLLIWMLTILLSAFPAVLLGISQLTLTPPVTLVNLFTYIAILVVAMIAVVHVAKNVFNVVTESFSIVGHAINGALAPYAQGMELATPARRPDLATMGILGAAAGMATLPTLLPMGMKAAFPMRAGTWEGRPATPTALEGDIVPSPNNHCFTPLNAHNPIIIDGHIVEETSQLPAGYKALNSGYLDLLPATTRQTPLVPQSPQTPNSPPPPPPTFDENPPSSNSFHNPPPPPPNFPDFDEYQADFGHDEPQPPTADSRHPYPEPPAPYNPAPPLDFEETS